jgi:hypothetical protein
METDGGGTHEPRQQRERYRHHNMKVKSPGDIVVDSTSQSFYPGLFTGRFFPPCPGAGLLAPLSPFCWSLSALMWRFARR